MILKARNWHRNTGSLPYISAVYAMFCDRFLYHPLLCSILICSAFLLMKILLIARSLTLHVYTVFICSPSAQGSSVLEYVPFLASNNHLSNPKMFKHLNTGKENFWKWKELWSGLIPQQDRRCTLITCLLARAQLLVLCQPWLCSLSLAPYDWYI